MTRALSLVTRWLPALVMLVSLNAYGQGWGTAQPIENDPGDAKTSDIAVAANGNAVAVWVQADGPLTNIWARNYATGSGLGTLQLIEAIANGTAQSPRVVIAPNGIAHAIWQQYDGTTPSIRASRFVPGSGWSAPKYLQVVLTATQAPGIAVDPDGSAIAVWAQQDIGSSNSSFSIYAAHSFNDQWSGPILLGNGPGYPSPPKVVIDPFDIRNALAVWDQYDGQHFNVYSSRFRAWFGTWDPPVLVEHTDAEAFGVDIAEGPYGIPVAVWRQQDGINGLMSVWASSFRGNSSGFGLWDTPQQISAGLSLGITSARVAVDPAGNATAVWGEGYIWANRYTVNSNSWGTAQLIESNVGDAVAPAITMDAGGNAIAVWMQNAGFGTNYSIYANRYAQGSGPGSGWGISQLLEFDNAGGAFNPGVGADSNGNAIALWCQNDGVRFNVQQNQYSASAVSGGNNGAIDPEGGPAGRGPQ
jgi:hypothetical protein